MLTIDQYVRAESLEQAYELCQKRNHVVLGGMLWLKMQDRKVGTAIDLCGLGLDRITETERAFELGAMVPLRALETHEGLNAMTRGAFARSVEHIVGVQFRNCATVGGSVFGRFGFSDVLTLLLALDARVVLQGAGELSLEEFCARPPFRDILVRVIVPKGAEGTVYLSQRNSATDFPVLTCAIARREGAFRFAIGARPGRARVYLDEKGLLSGRITRDSALAMGEDLSRRAPMGDNLRAGAEYRTKICQALVRRGLLKLEEAR